MDEIRRRIVDEGLAIARKAGWDASIAHYNDERFELTAKQIRLPFLHATAPALRARETVAVRLPPPWIVGVRSFADMLGCHSGHATVLAPIGCYASPLQVGGIDAVVIAAERDDDLGRVTDWTYSCASIGHTRCWMLNVAGVASCTSEENFQRRLAAAGRFRSFPEWMAIRDSATLSEFARDSGRADARFPDIVILEAKLCGHADRPIVVAWLALTDAAVSVALAEKIGAAVEPELTVNERFARIKANLDPSLGGHS
jgi:hypothetical protein